MTAPSWFTQHVETIFGGNLGPPRMTRPAASSVALIPLKASPAQPCWVEACGDERTECPACQGDGREPGSGHDGHIFGGYVAASECWPCDGKGSVDIDTLLRDFLSPSDFGLRVDADGTIYRDVNHANWSNA